jgi:hypothetical protein
LEKRWVEDFVRDAANIWTRNNNQKPTETPSDRPFGRIATKPETMKDKKPQTPKKLQPELEIWFGPVPIARTKSRVPVQPVPERVKRNDYSQMSWKSWAIIIGVVLWLVLLVISFISWR